MSIKSASEGTKGISTILELKDNPLSIRLIALSSISSTTFVYVKSPDNSQALGK